MSGPTLGFEAQLLWSWWDEPEWQMADGKWQMAKPGGEGQEFLIPTSGAFLSRGEVRSTFLDIEH